MGAAWTHWWNRHDQYGRIDYVFASRGVLPEIIFAETRIPHLPDSWDLASDHRPLLIKITVSDSHPWTDEQIHGEFPSGIHRHSPLPLEDFGKIRTILSPGISGEAKPR
jgi:hypothetical protein